jgi:serine protease Do
MGFANRAGRMPFRGLGRSIGLMAVLGMALAAPEAKAKPDPEDRPEPEWNAAPRPQSTARGALGISVQTVDESLADALDLKADKGALVTDVTPGGPGDDAGLKRGDVIQRVDDGKIADAGDLMDALAALKPGSETDLMLMRGIKSLEVTVQPRKAPKAGPDGKDSEAPDVKPKLGLKVADPGKGLRRRYRIGPGDGVVVLGVEDGSRAEAAGLEEGDFIVEAGGRPVAVARDLQAAVGRAGKKGKLILRVRRGEDVFFAVVRLAAKRA